jgi:hypothetical protein
MEGVLILQLHELHVGDVDVGDRTLLQFVDASHLGVRVRSVK